MKRKGTVLLLKGVYRIIITTPLKTYTYYGRTSTSFKNRFQSHRYELRRKTHNNKFLQNLYNKYGSESFTYDPLCAASNEETIITLEQALLDRFCNTEGCVNSSKNANNGFGVELGHRKSAYRLRNFNRSYEHVSGKSISFVGKYSTRDLLDALGILPSEISLTHRNGLMRGDYKRSMISGWKLTAIDKTDEMYEERVQMRRNTRIRQGYTVRDRVGAPTRIDEVRIKSLVKDGIDYLIGVHNIHPTNRGMAVYISELEGEQISRETVRKYMKDLGYHSGI